MIGLHALNHAGRKGGPPINHHRDDWAVREDDTNTSSPTNSGSSIELPGWTKLPTALEMVPNLRCPNGIKCMPRSSDLAESRHPDAVNSPMASAGTEACNCFSGDVGHPPESSQPEEFVLPVKVPETTRQRSCHGSRQSTPRQ